MDLAGRLAGGADLTAWMRQTLEALMLAGGPPRLEWWPAAESDVPLATAGPELGGARSELSLGPAGRIVAAGGPIPAEMKWPLLQLAPFVRWRLSEERLAQRAVAIAGRNAALDDFAGLVAHELKNHLRQAQLQSAAEPLRPALALIDELLEAARCDDPGRLPATDPAAALREALDELGPLPVTVESSLPASLPVSPPLLRMLLRNLIGNAAAAGARRVRLAVVSSQRSWSLHVRDDGVGLHDPGYRPGSGIGLKLCRRAVERHGGSLDLRSRHHGTLATVSFTGGVS